MSHSITASLSKLKFYFEDWLFSILLRLATVLALLILLGGNVHRNPGPLSFCHWNLGGLPTDNYLKKTILQAFLSVSNFDIVILGETHLTSKNLENELDIEGYSFERCAHSEDVSRGGIGYIINLPSPAFPNLI